MGSQWEGGNAFLLSSLISPASHGLPEPKWEQAAERTWVCRVLAAASVAGQGIEAPSGTWVWR